MGRWTDAQLGESFGPEVYELGPLHRRYVTGSRNDLALHERFADPTLAGNLAIRLLGDRYPGPIIHSHQDLRFLGRAMADDTVVVTGTLSLKEMRRGKAYVAIDCEFATGDRPVWWARMTCIWPEVHLRGEV